MAGVVALILGYVLSQFYRSFLAVLSPILDAELGMGPSELSYANGIWFIIFALMQFPVGKWLDTAGPRRTASWLLAIGGGGGIALFAAATSPWIIMLAMGLIGVGCSPILMSAFVIFARQHPPERFATLASTFLGIGTLGNVAGSGPLASAVEAFGWREVSVALAVFTVIIGLAIFFLVKDPAKLEGGPQGGSVLDVLRIRKLWAIFPMVVMCYCVAAGIRGVWAGPYLSEVQGQNTGGIGMITFWMALALSVGSIAYGPMDRIFHSRKWPVFIGNLIVLLALVWLVMLSQPSLQQVTIAFVAIGFFGASYPVLMAHGRSFIPAHLTGRGVTLINFFSIGGVGIIQFITGGYFRMVADPANPATAYDNLFILYAVLLAASLVGYLFAKDAKPSETA